ncbi:hypothetical protein M5K25_019209 [Dendrobium thyrsiflorum]|uniref:Uncharacterized protein n=1 Tax=Dendrobium thyrsiflorum TaxID=117978 RepID=A0ABD0UL79_DENTH
MAKLGKKARKFAKKNLQSILRKKRKFKAMFKHKAASVGHKGNVEKADVLSEEQSTGRTNQERGNRRPTGGSKSRTRRGKRDTANELPKPGKGEEEGQQADPGAAPEQRKLGEKNRASRETEKAFSRLPPACINSPMVRRGSPNITPKWKPNSPSTFIRTNQQKGGRRPKATAKSVPKQPHRESDRAAKGKGKGSQGNRNRQPGNRDRQPARGTGRTASKGNRTGSQQGEPDGNQQGESDQPREKEPKGKKNPSYKGGEKPTTGTGKALHK